MDITKCQFTIIDNLGRCTSAGHHCFFHLQKLSFISWFYFLCYICMWFVAGFRRKQNCDGWLDCLSVIKACCSPC